MKESLLIFLDFDGVTHPDKDRSNRETLERAGGYFCRLPRLEDMLREPEFADAKIVVSSTWRDHMTIHQLREFFALDVRDRVIGTTPRRINHQGNYQRLAEIKAFLANHSNPAAPWIAIDDLRQHFPAGLPNIYFTEFDVGLTYADIDEIKVIAREEILRAARGTTFRRQPALKTG